MESGVFRLPKVRYDEKTTRIRMRIGELEYTPNARLTVIEKNNPFWRTYETHRLARSMAE